MESFGLVDEFHQKRASCWEQAIEHFNNTLEPDSKERIILGSEKFPDTTGITNLFYECCDLAKVAIAEDDIGQLVSEQLAEIIEEIGQWESIHEQSGASPRVRDKIVALYAAILSFLVRTKTFYKKTKIARFTRAGLTPCAANFQTEIEGVRKRAALLRAEYECAVNRDQRQLQVQHALTFSAGLAESHRTMSSGFDRIQSHFQAEADGDATRRLVKWLDPERHPADDSFEPLDGSCEWIVEHKVYQDWAGGGGERILWVMGKLGCGKSTLANFLYRHHISSRRIIYHFQGSTDMKSAKPVAFLTFLLANILQFDEVVSHSKFGIVLDHLVAITQSSPDSSKASFERLWAILKDLVAIAGCITIIVDGVDECSVENPKELENLLENLEFLAKTSDTRIILLSQQMYKLEPYQQRSSVVSMTTEIVNRDIVLFIRRRLREKKSLARTQDEILKKVAGADGMFLWAKLFIDFVEGADTIRMQESRIHEFPERLFSAYQAILDESSQKLSEDELKRRREIFLILVEAYKPLTIEEISVAVALRPFGSALDEKDLLIEPKETLSKLCSRLAIISNGRLQLAHSSIKEFLTQRLQCTNLHDTDAKVSRPESNAYLTRKCFARLSEKQYQEPGRIAASLRKNVSPEVKDKDSEAEVEPEVLYDYAAMNWPIHLTSIPNPDEDILLLADNFLHGPEFVFWAEYIYGKGKDNSPSWEIRGKLERWYEKLPLDSQSMLDINDFFRGPYESLSKWYAEKGSDKTLKWLCLFRLGEWYMVIMDSDNAIKTRLEVMEGLEELLGKEHPLALRAASAYAKACLINRDLQPVVKILTTTSEIQLRVVGDGKPDAYESFQDLGLAEYYMTRYSESNTSQSKALAGFLRLLGSESQLYLFSYLYFGYAQESLGELKFARDIFENIYKTRSTNFGADNALALMAQVALAQTQRKLNDNAAATSNLLQAYEARDRILGINKLTTVDSIIHLIINYWDTGNLEDARKYTEIVSKPGILTAFFDRFCQVCHLRGLLHFDEGNWEMAIEIFRYILNESNQSDHTNNRALFWVRLDQAKILRAHGRNDEASEVFEDILTFRDSDTASIRSLKEEPQPPKTLKIAEDALRLIRAGKVKEADALLAENKLQWAHEEDFWIPLGGPYADTASMRGP
ncbi:hypothetical protein G7Y89_g12582 [Cudoniella acicularis]|uniref:NACHT domain-containing protein n=1 Tax=Cudoniella acicularis TaxID=354080 RepID=A0A8H4R9T5_9HELO|nr:hypothetical protein G7Y89_g12582 [Cudoniella acicularis]